jgi:hypothetical protein
MADSGISCWDDKYQFEFWRPVTGIRSGAIDGNSRTTGDATWTPLGAPNDNGGGTNFTPPFPSYASGHATFGAALFETMARFFGTNHISFTIGSDEFNGVTADQNGNVRPVVTRSFTSFSQAAEENGQSRIYLGIHWSFDKVQGIRQGTSIADFVFRNYLLPCGQSSFKKHVMEEFRALQQNNGTVVIATTDGKRFNALLGEHPAKTIATTASSTADTPTLVSDLMVCLNKGTWGEAWRQGKLLEVDLTALNGPLLSVFPYSVR